MALLIKSFSYAFKGLATAIKSERNFRLELCVAVYVFVFSAFYSLSRSQYALLVLVVAGVLALELINSVVERIVDILHPQKSPIAAAAKDIAAAAVLVFCIGAAVCGVLLFWNLEVFSRIFQFFAARPFFIVLLLLSLFGSAWFVFIFGEKKGTI